MGLWERLCIGLWGLGLEFPPPPCGWRWRVPGRWCGPGGCGTSRGCWPCWRPWAGRPPQPSAFNTASASAWACRPPRCTLCSWRTIRRRSSSTPLTSSSPKGRPQIGGGAAPPHEQQMAAEAQQDFRDSILPLLWDRRKRCQYLQGPARHAYGAAFLHALEQLCFEFLQRLESALPPPDLSQLYAVVWSHAPSGPRPPSLPILHRYLADMGHAPSGAVPRPLSSAQQQKGHSECSTPTKPRPQRRQLRPLRAQPLEFLGESEGESDLQRKLRSAPRRRSPPGAGPSSDWPSGGQYRACALGTPTPSVPRGARPAGSGAQRGGRGLRALPLPARRAQRHDADQSEDADRERDRDRHRTHRQGGAHQGARGGEGGDPPPAAAAHLQREADERREDGGRLQDPGWLRAAPGVSPPRGRGQAGRGAGLTAGPALRPRRRPRPY
ncbi:NEDD8 isoform X2 [Gallus gallus]|uniref:NEDD8 isoform X2 n=1 Tax=Gallus gallus TaxID=9031 RepID=UPI001F005A96|nr:NEDD8 isoform X2 [Gallus gallus]